MRKLKLSLIFNKKNKQITMSLPKKQLSLEDRERIMEFKKAKLWLEGFEK